MPSHQEVIEKLIAERDEARDLCRRLKQFLYCDPAATDEYRTRFNTLCQEISETDWLRSEAENPYLPPEYAEQLRKLEAEPKDEQAES